jgi:malonyl-CoA O-methyltransferase
MSNERPPTVDPQAAARWARMLPLASPWLHEEVARRMEERLQWMVLKPRQWVHWEPLQGGLQAQALLTRRYPKAESFVVQNHAKQTQIAQKIIAKPWWSLARWRSAQVRFEAPAQPVQMLWANMALHMASDPQALMARWSGLVAPDGFLMFSCLGPDTLRELRTLFATMGWPAPSHEFTDMHDWGDMLVRAGFAEPVMDMQRITLTFTSPQRLLQELRTLGRNLHPARFGSLRGRAWLARLHTAMDNGLRQASPGGPLQLTFEIIYGHAFKPTPRIVVQPRTTISLDAMRHALRSDKGPS